MGGLMRRLDLAFYPGIAVLAAAVVQPFVLPQQSRLWWPLVVVGLALVALSLVPWVVGARSSLGARTVRYGFNTLVMVVLVLGIIGVVEALSYRHNARMDLTENRRHSLSSQTIQLLKAIADQGERGRLLPERPAGQAPGRGPVQAVRALRRRQVHVEVGRSRPRAHAGQGVRRRGLRHHRAGGQRTYREGAGRRAGGEAHQRPGEGDSRGQAPGLHRPGPRRAGDHQHRA